MNPLTNSSVLIPGITSLLSISANYLASGESANFVADHIARSLDLLPMEPNSSPLQMIVKGLQEVAAVKPVSRDDLAEDLYQVGSVLSQLTTDRWCQESLVFSMRGLAQIIQASGDRVGYSERLLRKDDARDAEGEERWRLLSPLLIGVYHDISGMIAGLDSSVSLFEDEADGIREELTTAAREFRCGMVKVFESLPSIRIAAYLSAARSCWRPLLDEPFRNGDIERLALAIESLHEPLLRFVDGLKGEISDDLHVVKNHLEGKVHLVETSAALLMALSAIYDDFRDCLKAPVALHESLNPFMIQSVMGKRIDLIMDLADDPAPVLGPVCHLQQILYNLVANASDAIKGKGVVTVATRRMTAKSVGVDAAPGDYMELSVADTGPGIPSGILQNIFEKGVSGKQSTGLGLYVVQEVVRRMGGFIRVITSTAEPTGTTFLVYLPVQHSQPR